MFFYAEIFTGVALLFSVWDYSDIEELRRAREEFVYPKNSSDEKIVDEVFYHENEITNLVEHGNSAKDGMLVEFQIELGVDLHKNEASRIKIIRGAFDEIVIGKENIESEIDVKQENFNDLFMSDLAQAS